MCLFSRSVPRIDALRLKQFSSAISIKPPFVEPRVPLHLCRDRSPFPFSFSPGKLISSPWHRGARGNETNRAIKISLIRWNYHRQVENAFQTRPRRDWSGCRPANWKRVVINSRYDVWPMQIHRPRSSGGGPRVREWRKWPVSEKRCYSPRSIGITRPSISVKRPTPRVKAAQCPFKCPSTVSVNVPVFPLSAIILSDSKSIRD